jgi:WXG100 family type VII secretion target
MYVFGIKKVRNDVLRKGGNQMKIIVTPEEMRSNATNIRTEKANFEQCISSMRTIVNSMSGVFEGEAATAFVSNFESYNAQFTSFGELLESFAQKLDTAANTMEETDGGLAASMGQ